MDPAPEIKPSSRRLCQRACRGERTGGPTDFSSSAQSDCGPNRMRPSDSRAVCLGASACGFGPWCRCRSLAAGSSRCEFRCECLHGNHGVKMLCEPPSEVKPRRTREAPLASCHYTCTSEAPTVGNRTSRTRHGCARATMSAAVPRPAQMCVTGSASGNRRGASSARPRGTRDG